MLIISQSGPTGRKTLKITSPKRARTARKRKRGAALTILGNMTGNGCSRSFAGR